MEDSVIGAMSVKVNTWAPVLQKLQRDNRNNHLCPRAIICLYLSEQTLLKCKEKWAFRKGHCWIKKTMLSGNGRGQVYLTVFNKTFEKLIFLTRLMLR